MKQFFARGSYVEVNTVMKKIEEQGANILTSTPGRLQDIILQVEKVVKMIEIELGSGWIAHQHCKDSKDFILRRSLSGFYENSMARNILHVYTTGIRAWLYLGWKSFWLALCVLDRVYIDASVCYFRIFSEAVTVESFIPAELITAQVCETVALGIQVMNASIGKDESLSLKAEFKDKSSNDQSKSKSASKMFDQVSSFLVQLHLCLQWELLPF
ncbi:hypothetical protein P8452_67217 [Trifolium repens]|nr:hypothetical protein P8452_67217 [Trifolium repens]